MAALPAFFIPMLYQYVSQMSFPKSSVSRNYSNNLLEKNCIFLVTDDYSLVRFSGKYRPILDL